MTSPRPGRFGWRLTPFDRMNLLSIGVTLAIGVAILASQWIAPERPAARMSRHLMNYLGFIHFAVGYLFFFGSPFIRPQVISGNPRFYLKLLGCVAASALFFVFHQLELVAYTFFYLHAAENAVFHLYKLPPNTPTRVSHAWSANALFPMVLILSLLRVFPQYLTDLASPIRLGQLGVVVGCLFFLRALLPSTNWRQGGALIAGQPFLIGYFALIAIFVKERSFLYDLFIIWHYVIWFAYTWVQKPQARRRLIWSHLVFAVIYKALYLIDDAGIVLGHPRVLDLFVGHWGFVAQTMCHILLSFVFRTFPAATVSQPAVTPRLTRIAQTANVAATT